MASCSTYDMSIQLEVEITKMLSGNSVGITLFYLQVNHMRRYWEVKMVHTCGFEYLISHYDICKLLILINNYINPEMEEPCQ